MQLAWAEGLGCAGFAEAKLIYIIIYICINYHKSVLKTLGESAEVFSGLCFFSQVVSKLAQAPYCQGLQARAFLFLEALVARGRCSGAMELAMKSCIMTCKMKEWRCCGKLA